MSKSTEETVEIPLPRIAPLGVPIDDADSVHDLWDTFVKPGQSDDAPPQSVEDRALMAILRSVHEGLNRRTPCRRCSAALLTGGES